MKKWMLALSVVLVFSFCFAAAAQSYEVIGEEDQLEIAVWGYSDLKVNVPVRPGGVISVPFVGEVKAAGMTPQQLKDHLEKEYSKFIKTPTVSVVVTAVNSFKVYVMGAGIGTGKSGAETAGISGVSTGAMTLKRKTSLLQLLSVLGFQKDADLHSAYMMRDNKRLKINFHSLVFKGDASQDIQLMPNDLIFVPVNAEKRVRVIGAVKAPGMITYIDGMTVLDAILSAGGFNEFASQNSVVVMRKEGEDTKNIEVPVKSIIKSGDMGKMPALMPGDTIKVDTGLF
ncbi:MAG: polysaccharide biosynthesis/export family protein [Dissulfurispiraceae bacterium]|jgi:polysaccharide export outer membrane protein|nr:polysaccharide biosynthesis/export family protein [Dissulfurispiraceae bacterium]